MKSSLPKIVIVLILFLLSALFAQQNNQAVVDTNSLPTKAAVITCHNMIDDGLYRSIKRRTQLALDQGIEYLIYDIDTYGGDLFAAFDISNYFLHEVNPKAKTTAYVSLKAISAGAMISVACERIIMKEKATIGDCAPISMQGELTGVKREKVETVTRAAFTNAAQSNGYPDALLKAMVTIQIEVYKIKNLETGENEFFETINLPKDPNKYDLENKRIIVETDKLLTLTAADAVEYNIASAEVKDLNAALDFIAQTDNISFEVEPLVLKTNWSEEMVRWINSPAVMGILVMLTMLGVYMELNSPGVGLPGLVALICIVVIVSSKHLTGLANWVEVAMLIVGITLLLIELLVLPGFGIAGSLGILFIFTGFFGMLIKNAPDEIPWPKTDLDWQIFINGSLGLLLGFGGFLIIAYWITKYLPKSKLQFFSGLMLSPTTPTPEQVKPNMTAPILSEEVSVAVGDIGLVISTLRPTGKAKFESAIVDVVAQAQFIEKDTKVLIVNITGNKVIVKPLQDNEG